MSGWVSGCGGAYGQTRESAKRRSMTDRDEYAVTCILLVVLTGE